MRKHIGILVLGVLVLLLLLVYTVAFQVSELTDTVVLTTFGRATKVLSGRDANEAGLHVKWPYPAQEEVRYDARTFLFEDAFDQAYTRDQKTLMGSIFCAWRIEDAQRFLASIRGVEAAESKVRDVVRSAKNDAFKQWDLAELINTDPRRMKLRDVEDRVTREVSDKLMKDYGVQIVMIGVKRLGLTERAAETAIETMKQERLTMAGAFRTSGEARATAIRERARAAADKIRAFAERKAAEIRAEGDRDAAKYYAKFQGHEDLAIFLANLEMMRNALAARTVILLDESMLPFLKMFRAAPTAETIHQMATSAPSTLAPAPTR
jgi:modulator of FtsH protease HflC